MRVFIEPTQPRVMRVSWSGGLPPYQLQMSASVSGTWTSVGNPTMARSATIAADQAQAFFRVEEQVRLLTINTYQPRLTWTVPDLE